MSDTYLAATYPKARKPHRCDQCFRAIDPGETYRRQGYVYDGRMGQTVCCLQCESFAKDLHKIGFEGDEGGWAYLAELDGSEVAHCGFSRELDLYRAKWQQGGELVAYPVRISAGSDPKDDQ